MRTLTELESADAYCRLLTRRHYENFSVVSVFLRSTHRTHLTRIYGFCRVTDDFGDESTSRGANALERLKMWREQVAGLFSGRSAPIHPVLIALSETIHECSLRQELFFDLIQANLQDQSVRMYANWDELRAYCMLSAAPVGRMVLRVFGVEQERAGALSDEVCIGLQLANHAQDVRRDQMKGRSYLLREVVEREGIAGGVRDLSDRAERLLESGKTLEAMVSMPLRAQLALYRMGGLEVISSIRDLEYRTDETRPSLTSTRKAGLIPRALLQSLARMDHAPPQRIA